MNEMADRGHARPGIQRWAVLLAAMLTGVLVASWRKEPAAILPADLASQNVGRAEERRCIECHVQAETFPATGHARTLSPASADESLELLKQFAQSEKATGSGVELAIAGNRVLATYQAEHHQSALELDWCFGSGKHARTWTGTLADSWGATDLVEFRWTWFHAIDGFDVTPGQPEKVGETFFGGLGVMYDHPKTRRCFGCHSTYMNWENGALDESTLQPGVTCQRCHGLREEHIASEGQITVNTWRGISQEESINRCAQCHRRADEMEPKDIRPDNKDIARFQPVGLVQSKCFQDPKMTCIVCHNPHIPLEEQKLDQVWQCVQCHDAAQQQVTCGAGFTQDCVRCHMPKVRGDSPLDFTDHWIRVRSDVPLEPGRTQHEAPAP